jgi:hypothetical protein
MDYEFNLVSGSSALKPQEMGTTNIDALARRRPWPRRAWLEVYGSFDMVTFNPGITTECPGGIESGHRELPGWIGRWMDR